jgi:hypothetical protein
VNEGDDENSENVKNTRYNLAQWWDAKAFLYPSSNAAIQRDLNILDMWAHRWWGQLEQKLAVFSAGDSAKVSDYSKKSEEAYAKSAALAEIVNNQRMERSANERKNDAAALPDWLGKNMPDDSFWKALRDQFKTPSGSLGLFGIPWWAYAAAGTLLLVVLLKPPAPSVSVSRK